MWVTESGHCQPCASDDSGYCGDTITSEAVVVNQAQLQCGAVKYKLRIVQVECSHSSSNHWYSSTSRTFLLKLTSSNPFLFALQTTN